MCDTRTTTNVSLLSMAVSIWTRPSSISLSSSGWFILVTSYKWLHRSDSYPDLMGSFPGLIDSYPGLVVSYPDHMGSYPDYMDSYPGLIDSHPDLMGSYPGLIDSYPDLVGSYPGLFSCCRCIMHCQSG